MNTKDKTNPVEGVKERLWNAIPDPADESPMGTIVQVLDLTALLSDHTRLEAEVARLRGAVTWYAEAGYNEFTRDQGHVARTTLGDQ